MNFKYIASVMFVVVLISSTGAMASQITDFGHNPDSFGEAQYEHPYFYNNVLKLELHSDTNGNDNDTSECEYTQDDSRFPWDIFDNGPCDYEAYDYVLDPNTDEVIGQWSMFKLQQFTGGQWKNLKVVQSNYEDCSDRDGACVKRVLELSGNNDMNVTYYLKNKDDKIKFLIDIEAGNDAQKEFRLKYSLTSNKNITESGQREVNFDNFFYDWNDIENNSVEEFISEDGTYFEQLTYLGTLSKGDVVQIDPLITTITTTTNTAHTNLFQDSFDNLWFYAQNTTHRLMFVSTDSGDTWALNSTDQSNFTNGATYSGGIDSSDVISLVDSGNTGTYINFTADGTWFTSTTLIAWGGSPTQARSDINQAGQFIVAARDTAGTDSLEVRLRNATTGSIPILVEIDIGASGNVLDDRVTQIQTADDVFAVTLGGDGDFPRIVHRQFRNLTTGGLIDFDTNDWGGAGANSGSDILIIDDASNEILTCLRGDTPSAVEQVRCIFFNGTDLGTSVSSILPLAVTSPNYENIFLSKTDNNVFINFGDNSVNEILALQITIFSNDTILIDNSTIFNVTGAQENQTNSAFANQDLQVLKTFNMTGDRYFFSYPGSWFFGSFPSTLNINVFQETDQTPIENWNVTITNGTITESFGPNNNTLSIVNITGDLTLEFSAPGFLTRIYFEEDVLANETRFLNAFLLNSSDPNVFFVRYHVVDSIQNGLVNFTVQVQRQINGTYTTVEERLTDATGIAGVSEDSSVQFYRVNVFNTLDNLVFTGLFQPVLADEFIIIGGFATNYTSLFDNVTFTIDPQGNTLPVNFTGTDSENINFTITASDASLEWFSLNVTWNDTVVFFENSSNITGGKIIGLFNITAPDPNQVFANVLIKRVGFNVYNTTKTYYVLNITENLGTLNQAFIFANTLSISDTTKSFLALMFTMLFVVLLALRGFLGLGIFAAGSLGIFVLFGWFNFNIYILAVFILAAYYLLLRRFLE